MITLQTRTRVAEDGTLEVKAATDLPPGEHDAVVVVGGGAAERPKPRVRVADLPVHDEPWDDSVSLRREDLYGDDGR